MPRIAILISGTGINMAEINKRVKSHDLSCEISFVASDNPVALGLQYAQSEGLETVLLPYGTEGRDKAEKVLHDLCCSRDVEWIVLAGFMKILSPRFVRKWERKIVNIHPALLPSFPGTNGARDAWDYGVRVTGVTVHLVDSGVDTGIILSQKAVTIEKEDTLDYLVKKIHEVEYDLYWQTLKKLFQGAYSFQGRRAIDDSN
ncbi:MAG: phosphoribosylglycinamide formyltransferase [Aminobacterium colombiense]|nr:phosphoribosylglycinamide formyltransferase [Aminobacterium colombiense]